MSVDGLPVIDDTGAIVVVVMFQDMPDVELKVAIVVLEFHEPLKVVVPLLVDDMSLFVALPLIAFEVMVTVEVAVGMLVSVLVTVLVVNEPEELPLSVADPEVIEVLPFDPGPLLCEVISEDVPVTLEPVLPDELLAPEVVAVLEPVDDTLLLIDVIAVEFGELPLTLVEVPVDVDNADPVSLPEDTDGVPEMVNVEVPTVVQLRDGEVMFILDEPPEEGTAHPLEVRDVPEPDGPDEEDNAVAFTPEANDGELVRRVVAVSAHVVAPEDKDTFWRLVVTAMAEVAVTENAGRDPEDVNHEDCDAPEEFASVVELPLLENSDPEAEAGVGDGQFTAHRQAAI
ncbi:hypothetical protein F5Y08DRAFT_348186 [Xylaria arbuscula]|nr:hypothetical protein F5Y08DRAFT_348186 [Xylaria arbuscula]